MLHNDAQSNTLNVMRAPNLHITLLHMEKKFVSVSLRITETQRDALDSLTAQTKLGQSKLIEIAIDGLLDYAKAHDGRLTLPLDFSTFFTETQEALDEAGKRLADAQVKAFDAIMTAQGVPIVPAEELKKVAEDPTQYGAGTGARPEPKKQLRTEVKGPPKKKHVKNPSPPRG